MKEKYEEGERETSCYHSRCDTVCDLRPKQRCLDGNRRVSLRFTKLIGIMFDFRVFLVSVRDKNQDLSETK